jgi:hypothetical protein
MVVAGTGTMQGSVVYSHRHPSDSEEGHKYATPARRGGIGFFNNPLAARRALSPALTAAGQVDAAHVEHTQAVGGVEGLEQWEVEEGEAEDEEVGAVVVMPGSTP